MTACKAAFRPRHTGLGMLAAAMASVAMTLALSAHAATAVNRGIQGTWRGQYSCAQGVTDLTLTISGLQNDNLSALFKFEVRRAKAIPGEFRMTGFYDAKQRLVSLLPTGWVSQPQGYIAVGIEARMNQAGDALSGRIVHASCSWIKLSR